MGEDEKRKPMYNFNIGFNFLTLDEVRKTKPTCCFIVFQPHVPVSALFATTTTGGGRQRQYTGPLTLFLPFDFGWRQ